jgi:hypothetical protein
MHGCTKRDNLMIYLFTTLQMTIKAYVVHSTIQSKRDEQIGKDCGQQTESGRFRIVGYRIKHSTRQVRSMRVAICNHLQTFIVCSARLHSKLIQMHFQIRLNQQKTNLERTRTGFESMK